jgi:hypothetical protein
MGIQYNTGWDFFLHTFKAFLQLHELIWWFGAVEVSRGGAEVWQEMDRRVMSDSTTAGFAPRSKVERLM